MRGIVRIEDNGSGSSTGRRKRVAPASRKPEGEGTGAEGERLAPHGGLRDN